MARNCTCWKYTNKTILLCFSKKHKSIPHKFGTITIISSTSLSESLLLLAEMLTII